MANLQATTAIAASDALRMFDEIEYRARDIKNLAFAAIILGNDGFSADAAEGKTFSIPRNMGEAMLSMTRLAEDQAEMLEADVNRVRDAVHPFLKEDRPALEPDRFLDLLARYREQLAVHNASPETDDDNALADATYYPLYAQLRDETPVPSTAEGAIAALRFGAEGGRLADPLMTIAMNAAVLAFLEGRA